MKFVKPTLLSLAFLLSSTVLMAQQKQTEMADLMRSNGRIYVVVAVMVTILTGLVLYVARLDKKISKLEKALYNKGPTLAGIGLTKKITNDCLN